MLIDAISRWWNDTVNNVVGHWLTPQQSFDQGGNLLMVIDPRGVRKDLSYADAFMA